MQQLILLGMLSWWNLSLSRSVQAAFVADPKRHRHGQRQSEASSSGRSSSALAALSASMEPMDPERRPATSLVKPPITETATPLPELDKLPVSHKIVVFGATGQVGRLVVRHLLEEAPDGTLVVAVVRDYDKACRVLYDDLIVTKQERKGPKLQIVQAELVSRSDTPAAPPEHDDWSTADEDAEWLKRAQAAARFYGNQVSDYDDGRVTDTNNTCALEQIMEGCTAIVSCVGSVRYSKPWTDWWLTRLLRKDVRPWCADATHPFYTHYFCTRKILHLAEREQERRDVLWQAQDSDDSENDSDGAELIRKRRDKNAPPRRIRFVRLSDLAVTQQPWHLVPVLTNALRSMVFRYHEMADDLLARSRLLDTVIIRAGELVDEERDDDDVGVQVHVDDYEIQNATNGNGHANVISSETLNNGKSSLTPSRNWSPARVGRDDVASLLSAVVLAPWLNAEGHASKHSQTKLAANASIHTTLAVRWSGNTTAMAPYPAQGKKTHGCRTAKKSLQKAIRKQQRSGQLSTRETSPLSRFKPYGVCVAIPLYLTFALLLRNLGKALWLASQGNKIAGVGILPAAFLPNFRPFCQAVIRFVFRKAPAAEYISF